MTTEQILENNELIGIFIGGKLLIKQDFFEPEKTHRIIKFEGDQFRDMVCNGNHGFATSDPIHCLLYHAYYDWLIPVCERIESIKDDFHGYFGVYIHSNCCTIQGSKLNTSVENFHPAYFLESYGNTKIEAVYLAVIQFIKFWNDQKRKDSQGEKSQTSKNINQ